jgi:class 3 adenylate cyclase/tetratricopeptide (TPR) repeat protein
VIRCPECGEENPDRARFCLACATPLAERRQPEEERKVVSILFVDLVGFTDRSDRADPEDVRATLRPYHARVKREIEYFGGTVEKFVGDAVMAVFGAPIAHEDDSERAVRAGLRVLEAISELNDGDPELALAARAAVNSGEAVVSVGARPEAGEGIVTGDVVNTASRLQQVAPVGGLVVGEATYDATAPVIDYEALEPVVVKGKSDRLAIWLAKRVRSSEPAAPTPFVGREDELALLQQTYGRMVRDAGVQLVTMTGEPGIGKTRLLSEFRTLLEQLPEAPVWRQGRCLPYGEGITFWALGEIVKGHTGIFESDTPEQASGKLEAALTAAIADASEREWFNARLAPLVGARVFEPAGSTERAELFTAWRRFLEAVAAERPLVVVLEDLHWADDPLLDFVEHLVDWSSGVPLLVICAARPELYERRPGWGGGKRNSTTISLSPLSGEETMRLISALLSQAVLPAETQAVLLDRAGGNPLYAEEFMRMLSDRGILARRGRRLEIASDAEIPVPASVQSLIAARVDTLDSERKRLLQDAAVVGKVFWTGAVAAIEDSDAARVRHGLHELVAKELVRPVRTSSVEGQDEFSFWHVLVRDVCYQQIPRAARARKHRLAAEWIERIAEDRVADHAEILAHHYGQAVELALAAGAADEARELELPTRRFLVMAGDRALALDVARARFYYERALELLEPGQPERAAALTKAAEAAYLDGAFVHAEQRYEEAIAELRSQGKPLGVGEAMVSLSLISAFRGETKRGRELLAEVVPLLEQAPPGRELANAYAQTAREHMISGRFEASLEWSEKALALGEQLRLDAVVANARQFRGLSRTYLGDLDGVEDLREALRMSLERGFSNETARAYVNLGEQTWLTKGPDAGLAIYRDGIDFCGRRGIGGPVLWMKGQMLWLLFDAGEWEELLAVADELISWERANGRSYFGVMALSYKAQVLARQGAADDAAALRDEFLPRARDIDDAQILVPALAIGALIDEVRGQSAGALSLIEEFGEATHDHLPYRANHIADAVRICLAHGRVAFASELLQHVPVALPRHTYARLTAEAVVAEFEGDREEATARYVEAADGWKDYGFVLERGLALLGAGRCFVAIGRYDEATSPLQLAHELFAGVGAEPLLHESDALLSGDRARTGTRSRMRT